MSAMVTPFASLAHQAREAMPADYILLEADIGLPELDFSARMKKNTLFLRRKSVGEIIPDGVETVATLCNPADRTFSVDIDIFVFDGAVEAQPCSDQSLLRRGFTLAGRSDQHGLLVGGASGSRHSGGATVQARSFAAVRGRSVLAMIVTFPDDGDSAHDEAIDILLSTFGFKDGVDCRFLAEDIDKKQIVVFEKSSIDLSFPKTWKTQAETIGARHQNATFVFYCGNKEMPAGLMTFGFRRGQEGLDDAQLYLWSSKIAKEYVRQNPSSLQEPVLEREGKIKILDDAGFSNLFCIFSVLVAPGNAKYQIRTVVLGRDSFRFAFSLFADTMDAGDMKHFINYSVGVTGFEMIVDSFARCLIGRGFD